jgi:DNA-binding NarL/FixJ family response regulator
MSIRIILADDHAIVRSGLARLLQQHEGMEIVGQADNGISAVALVKQLSPDVVVMDIGMPDLNGIEATRQIVKESPRIKVIGLSMHSSKKYIREMFKAGASGYLLKNCSFEELTEAINVVIAGKTYISPSISTAVIGDYISGAVDDKSSVFAVLTEREREVLQLLAEGKTTKQIAERLHISSKTVEAHRLKIMHKLDIDNIAQLTKYAIQEGLTMPEP